MRVDINLTSIIAKHEPDQNYLYRVSSPCFFRAVSSGKSAMDALSGDFSRRKNHRILLQRRHLSGKREGGRATQLTTHPAYDSRPVWSPDGKTIAFTSARDEGLNLYPVPVTAAPLPA